MNQAQYSQQKETVLDGRVILRALWKRAWIIAVVALVFFVAVYLYCSVFVTPIYVSNFTTYINNRMAPASSGTTLSDLNASMGLSYVYQEIILSRSVLTEAASQCGVDLPYSSLVYMVGTSVSENAPVITVYVRSADPEISQKLAAAISQVAPEHVNRVVEGSTMNIIDPPLTPTAPSGTNPLRNALAGMLVGILASALVISVVELICDKVQDADDLETRYQVLVLGSIPDIMTAQRHDNKRYGYGYGKARGGK